MSLAHSPKVTTDGLVFYFDQGNTDKSWRGAPATNFITNGHFSGGNGVTQESGSNATNEIIVFRNPGNSEFVLRQTGTVAFTEYQINLTTQLAASTTYVMSGWYAESLDYSSADGSRMFHSRAYSTSGAHVALGIGIGTVLETRIVNGITWRYCYATITTPADYSNVFEWYVGYGGSAYTGNRYYTNLQMEVGTLPSRFVNGTRSNTQAILDLTGRNTITATNLTYASDGSFSFVRANSPTIATNLPVTSLPALSNFSLSVWLNITALPSVANNNGVIFGATYYSGTAIYWYSNGSTFTIYGYIRGNDAYRVTSSYTLPLNTVHHIVLTNDNSAGTLNLYVNGALFSSVATATQQYNSSLAADAGNIGVNKPQVDGGGENVYTYFTGSVYSAAIHNKALSPQEVRQNFNAHRGRYGI